MNLLYIFFWKKRASMLKKEYKQNTSISNYVYCNKVYRATERRITGFHVGNLFTIVFHFQHTPRVSCHFNDIQCNETLLSHFNNHAQTLFLLITVHWMRTNKDGINKFFNTMRCQMRERQRGKKRILFIKFIIFHFYALLSELMKSIKLDILDTTTFRKKK